MNGTKKMTNIARVITAKWCEKVGFGKTPLNKHSQCDIYSGARFVPERAWHKTITFINAPAVGVRVTMNRLFILFVALLFVGCEAHLVTKELYIADPQPSGDSRCIPPKIFPIELSNKKRTNSILWIPLIPAPWHDREDVEKIRIEVAYDPAAKECSADEVYLVSDGIEYSPEMAYLFEFRGEETRCIYKFNISSSDVGRSNSLLKLNRGGSCGVVEQSLVYKKKTVYENHFQPW